tara:strand:- start:2382 stop:3389 length:1008 start_codon:yes stop_codon:yes gene_type:complete
MKRVNYLNNRDLLKQIHMSKNTFCSYVSSEDSAYDIILTDIKKINRNAVALARKARAKRLTQEAWETAKAAAGRKNKLKMSDFEVSPRKIDKTDLVFRVMTFDHIPKDDKRKNNPKTVADHHTKLNFPPFQHFRISADDKPKCVGKSHWTGGMQNGQFSLTHGKVTGELAKMYMKLCERYGTRSNWRGYTYNDEMRSQALMQLSQIGLQFDESKSENPFAYYTAAITNSFTRILIVEKKNQNIRDDIMEQNNLMPSMTRQMSEQIEKQKKKIEKETAPVKVATKTSMALFNKHYKKTGKMDYSILKYVEKSAEKMRALQPKEQPKGFHRPVKRKK